MDAIAGTLNRITPEISLVRLSWRQDGDAGRAKTGRAYCVLCLDRSGSMSGAAWTQVQRCVGRFVDNVKDTTPDVEIVILLYNTSCMTLRGAQLDQFRQAAASNRTDFSRVFQTLCGLIHPLEPDDCMRVCFFTDGDDTVSKQSCDSCLLALQRAVVSKEAHVVIDVMAYRTTENRAFLERVRNSGSTPGIYQFCTSVDDMGDMITAVTELFGTTRTQRLDLGPIRPAAGAPLEVVGTTSTDAPPDAVTVGDDGQALVEFFVVTPPADAQRFRTTVNGDAVVIVELPPDQLSVAELYESRMVYAERLLFKACEKGTQLVRADTQQLQDLLKFCASALSERRLTKEQRTDMLMRRQELQARLDDLHVLVEDKARRSRDEVLSRMANLRYVGVMDSARRRRQLAQRAADNAGRDRDFDLRLRALTYSPDALPADPASQDFFQCTIGMVELDEVMSDDHDGVLGFGLAVTRPETVVDAPTMIRIVQASNTLMTRQSLLDAIAYNVDVTGKLRCSYNEKEAVGHTVGRSREPINAWLPLYICRDHWARVRVLMRPTLGYFCCMDPLAFQEYQYDVMLMVLGTMASRSARINERDLTLFLAFRDTCRQLFDDEPGRMDERVVQPLRRFATSPEHRLKHHLNNLLVTVGALFVAPRALVVALVTEQQLFVLLLQESIRRACGDLLRAQPPPVGQEIVYQLLCDSAPEPFDAASFTLPEAAETIEPAMAGLDARIDVDGMALDPSISKAGQRHLAICGQALCSSVPGPQIQKKTSQAAAFYQQWRQGRVEAARAMVRDRATLPCAEDVTVHVNDTMQALLRRITGRMYPTFDQLGAVRGLLDHFHQQHETDGVVEGARPVSAVITNNIQHDPRMMRALLVQAVACASNADARANVASGAFVEPSDDDFVARVTAQHADRLQRQFTEAVDGTAHALFMQLLVDVMVSTDDVYAFVHLLSAEVKQRDQWFQALVSRVDEMTHAAEKLSVLMSGRHDDTVVFAYGNGWRPESRPQRDALMAAVGDDVYAGIVTRMSSNVLSHTYRPSGVPNRHGSSNDNPHDYLHCAACIANGQKGHFRY